MERADTDHARRGLVRRRCKCHCLRGAGRSRKPCHDAGSGESVRFALNRRRIPGSRVRRRQGRRRPRGHQRRQLLHRARPRADGHLHRIRQHSRCRDGMGAGVQGGAGNHDPLRSLRGTSPIHGEGIADDGSYSTAASPAHFGAGNVTPWGERALSLSPRRPFPLAPPRDAARSGSGPMSYTTELPRHLRIRSRPRSARRVPRR